MPTVLRLILIGSVVSAVEVCPASDLMFEHRGTRQIADQSITVLVAEYPDANHFVAGTAEGRTYTYRHESNQGSDNEVDPLPFDECEQITRLSASRIAFLSRESPIAWEHSSQTAKRLRRKPDSVSFASILVGHPETQTMTIADTDGLSIWSTESLDVIWVPTEVPLEGEPAGLFDATADYLFAGNIVGDVWKLTPSGLPERVRNSEYAREAFSSKELPLLERVMINVVALNSSLVAIVMRDKHTGYIEWWTLSEASECQLQRWVKTHSLQLTMNCIEAKPYGVGNSRCIYVSSNDSICCINLQRRHLATCITVPKDSSPMHRFSVSSDQATILTGHENGTVQIWKK